MSSDPAVPRSVARPVGGRGIRKRPTQRAGRPVLDPDIVSWQALQVMSESGVEAVTMSRVARDLGVTVRAIYHWIPSRAELLTAAALRAQESIPIPVSTGDWRQDLRRYRDDTFTWLDTYPGILDVHLVEGIATVGPRVVAAHEAGLRLFVDMGFSPRRAALMQSQFANWVGATHHFQLRPHRHSEGRSDVFERVVTDTHSAAAGNEMPLTAAAGTVSLDEQLEAGFDWLLDSIEATLHRTER